MLSSLFAETRQRLSKRVERNYHGTREDDEETILRHAVDVLEAQPLVAAMEMPATDVLRALQTIPRRDRTLNLPTPPSASDASNAGDVPCYGVPPPPAGRRCDECGTDGVVADEKAGCDVCGHCGASQGRFLSSLAPFRHEEDVERAAAEVRRAAKRPRGVRGVPDWMLRSAERDAEDVHMAQCRDELAHWNQFTHHSVDALEGMARDLHAWTDGAHTRKARLAALLLMPRLQMPDEEALRRRIRDMETERRRCEKHHLPPPARGPPLETLRSAVPAPTFRCETCGALEHTAKGARFHCRGSFGRRAR